MAAKYTATQVPQIMPVVAEILARKGEYGAADIADAVTIAGAIFDALTAAQA